MKKILFLICALCICLPVFGKTINWYVDSSVYDTTTCSTGGDLILPTAPTKRGYTFMGWVSYTPIEYIQFPAETNTRANIDTGIHASESITVRIKFQTPNGTCATGQIFGCYTTNNLDDYRLFCQTSTSLSTISNSRTRITTPDLNLNQPLDLIIGEYYIKDFNSNSLLAGTEIANPTTWTISSKTILIGSNINWSNSNVQIYLFQIYDNGTLVRNMIPVKDLNNVPCMFDTVSGQFFYNAGTGDFVAGPEI